MNSREVVTIVVTQPYRVPISGGYDPYNIDDPMIADKIPKNEKNWLKNPEYYFYPEYAERFVEIIEVSENDGKTPTPHYTGHTEQLFNQWVRSAIEHGLTTKDELVDWLEQQIEKTLSPEPSPQQLFYTPFAISDDEIILRDGNIISICLNEENTQEIQISFINGAEYFLEGEEAKAFLRTYDRKIIALAPNLLKLIT